MVGWKSGRGKRREGERGRKNERMKKPIMGDQREKGSRKWKDDWRMRKIKWKDD